MTNPLSHPRVRPTQIQTSSARITADLPTALAAIAAGRDHINTAEFARAINKAEQTIRKLHCLTGEAYGIRPVKVGNRLLFPVLATAALLNGGTDA